MNVKAEAEPEVKACPTGDTRPNHLMTAVKTKNWFVRKSTDVTTDIPYP